VGYLTRESVSVTVMTDGPWGLRAA
jgi:hypothetical protein